MHLLVRVVMGSAKVKAFVVTHDEKESGLRALLNFGHSIGHAIEGILAPEILHGECVSIGMAREAEIAKHLGYLDDMSYGRLCRCLKAYGLPLQVSDGLIQQYASHKTVAMDQVLEFMKVDKKNLGSQKRIVLLSGIGQVVEKNAVAVDDQVIQRILAPCMHVKSAILKSPVTLKVPGSKSISNRALLLAALGQGRCRLHGLLFSDDVHVMLDALHALAGITYTWENRGQTLVIDGAGGKLSVPSGPIYLGNAGTSARFLTTVATLAPSGGSTLLTGNARMKLRPIGPLVTALNANGCKIDYLENSGSLPLSISSGGLPGGLVSLSASVSSQYVSSILMAAPYAATPLVLDLSGDAVISQPYIDMTISMMTTFGIQVDRIGSSNKYQIPLGCYQNPAEYYIEGDASSATYPLAYAAMTGSTVTLSNMGSVSLQGDSEFAIKVLEPMGCIVRQTETTTTVTGPAQLLPLPLIDMETMTDAFLTASVLAAISVHPNSSETNITGIANQRVKECNRIAAMVEQLSHFGVKAKELPDGIQINGQDRTSLKHNHPGGVHCYDDHRIAMSFSLLASALQDGQGALITEKRCVEKTWPSWWSVLENTLGADIVGVEPALTIQQRDPTKSIILIGMRGAGKTHLGKAAASFLKRECIDLDDYFKTLFGLPIAQVIETKGWDEFRRMELECLEVVLNLYPSNAVIACGGGIVETPAALDKLKRWDGFVISIHRPFQDILKYLNADTSRPQFSDDLIEVWNRRQPLFRQASLAEFVIPSQTHFSGEGSYWSKIESTFKAFVQFHLQGCEHPWVSNSQRSYFLSLTFDDLSNYSKLLSSVTEGVHAVELRVDLLKSTDFEFVGQQIALLRHLVSLPIIFTVRTVQEGGKFIGSLDLYRELLEHAFRWGCEFVDVEGSLVSPSVKKVLDSRHHSKIIASFHDVHSSLDWDSTMKSKYDQLATFGDIVKLIGVAKTEQDNLSLGSFCNTVRSKPVIAMLMGPKGKLSRVLNRFMTPVTHSDLLMAAAPGQLSLREIHQIQTSLGLIEPKRFYLFGMPISSSMSPTLHNAGFERLGLPHSYHLFETSSWNELSDFLTLNRANFGGASVTIPLKVDMIKHKLLDGYSKSAIKIGAVNTVVCRDNQLFGDNTDWIGIQRCFESRLKANSKVVGIVIGAGGTARAACFALLQSSVSRIIIWNRTLSKAEELAHEFGCVAVNDLNNVLHQDESFVLVSTVPANAQSEIPLNDFFQGNACGFSSSVCIDMAYRPRQTLLLELASSKGLETVQGIQVLIEQGFEQFSQWTGCHPPYEVMRSAVEAAYH